MADCLIGLGSNLGNKTDHLRFALKALARLPRTRLIRNSSFYASSPLGGQGQNDYFNAAALIKTGLSPMGLLVELKKLEAERGRKPGPRWGPRPLDCDILFYGRLRMRTRFLRIPHPRALSRRFVLEPLAEILPNFRPPAAARGSLSRRLERLNARGQNVRILDVRL